MHGGLAVRVLLVRLAVAGGRDHRPTPAEVREFEALWKRLGATLLMHGACCDRDGNLRAVDAWAERWAILNEEDYVGMPAKWKKDGGKRAGPIRYHRLAKKADALAAFCGGNGTNGTAKAFEVLGKPVYRITGAPADSAQENEAGFEGSAQ